MKTEETLARGLGWFSIGLGLTEVLAPGSLTRCLGMQNREGLLRGYGFREIGAGVGILFQQNPGKYAPWLWGRVGGDALDLATLFSAYSPQNPKRGNVGVAIAAVAGVTLMDILAAERLQHSLVGSPDS